LVQKFVKCPLCGVVYDTVWIPSVEVRIDGVRRTAHLVCVTGMAPPAVDDSQPNDDDTESSAGRDARF
jgi:hypothetical protein